MISIRNERQPISWRPTTLALLGAVSVFSPNIVSASYSDEHNNYFVGHSGDQQTKFISAIPETSSQLEPVWQQDLKQAESKTPIMDAFSAEMDAFWLQAERGELEFSEQEIALAERLLELYPNHLLR